MLQYTVIINFFFPQLIMISKGIYDEIYDCLYDIWWSININEYKLDDNK